MSWLRKPATDPPPSPEAERYRRYAEFARRVAQRTRRDLDAGTVRKPVPSSTQAAAFEATARRFEELAERAERAETIRPTKRRR